MKRRFLLSIILIFTSGMLSADPQSSPITTSLYNSSVYGWLHPLAARQLPITKYALTKSQIEDRKRTDRAIGVGVNLFAPGVGSMIIGDPHGIPILIGYYGSSLVSAFALEFASLSMIVSNGNSSAVIAWYSIAGGGAVSALIFGIWGLISPINFVKNKDYSE